MKMITTPRLQANREIRRLMKEIPRMPAYSDECHEAFRRIAILAHTFCDAGQNRQYVVEYIW